MHSIESDELIIIDILHSKWLFVCVCVLLLNIRNALIILEVFISICIDLKCNSLIKSSWDPIVTCIFSAEEYFFCWLTYADNERMDTKTPW